MALYDSIGRDYASYRRPDPRIARAIVAALGEARDVVNVGAGSGSYEPRDRRVVAVEPSLTMIRQRSGDAATAVQAVASALPFRDEAFSASLAILTVHHWQEQSRGLEELARVARERVVLLTWDPDECDFWLTNEYLPEAIELDRACMPTMADLRRIYGRIRVESVPIPNDCSDGFMAAYWRRPEAYLDAGVRSAISTFAKLTDAASGLQRLADDLRSGEWQRRFGDLLERSEIDPGYRLVVADLH